jgi:hypothetical protein
MQIAALAASGPQPDLLRGVSKDKISRRHLPNEAQQPPQSCAGSDEPLRIRRQQGYEFVLLGDTQRWQTQQTSIIHHINKSPISSYAMHKIS